MKRYVFILFMTLAGILTGYNQSDEIRNVLEKQVQSWNQGDLEGYMQGYWKNDSLVFIGRSGLTYGWHNTLSNYRKSYQTPLEMGQLSFTHLRVKKLSGKICFVTGQWKLTRATGDLSGWFSLVFEKKEGSWVITHDHSS